MSKMLVVLVLSFTFTLAAAPSSAVSLFIVSPRTQSCRSFFADLWGPTLLKGFRGENSQLRRYVSLLPRVSENQLVSEIAEAIGRHEPSGQWQINNDEIEITGSVVVKGSQLDLTVTQFYSRQKSGLRLFLPRVLLGISTGVNELIILSPQVRSVRLTAIYMHNGKLAEFLQKLGFHQVIEGYNGWQELVLKKRSRFCPMSKFK